MVNVKRAICWALFWGLFTNFHEKFILTHVLFPFWQVLRKDEIITMPHTNVYAAHVACSQCFFAYYVNFKRQHRNDIFHSLLERLQITHIIIIISAHDYSQQQIHVIYCQLSTRTVRMHLILGAEIYSSSKNLRPYKYTVYLWE